MVSTNTGANKPRMKVQVAAPESGSPAPQKAAAKPAAKPAASQPRPQVKARLAVDAPPAAPAPAKAKPAKAKPAIKVSQPATSVSSTAHKASAPKVTAPKSTVQQSPAPKVTAPKSSVQQSPAPKVTAPKSSVQKSPAPKAAPKAAPRITATPTAFVDDEEVARPQETTQAPRVAAAPEVEPSYEYVREEAAPQPKPRYAPAQQAPAEPRKSFNLGEWVDRTFGGHKGAFYGGLIALIVALLVFAIGFWRVLFISLLVVVGVAIGQVVDGDPRIIRTIRNLFPNDDGDE